MNAPIQQLTCPKCRGAMTSYERSGIVVDQCVDCRGIFLDRGELERLIDLDSGGTVAARPQQPQAHAAPSPSRHDWDDDSDSHRRHPGQSGSHKPKKRHSMLKELLDF